METLKKQTSNFGGERSMFSPEGSPANPSALLESEKDRKTTATSGRKCFAQYERYGPLGLLVKTLVESSAWYNPVVKLKHQAALFEETDKETILEQEYVVETVCRDLEQEGYSVQPIVIPACAVGAPHRRDRIFFIAYRSDAGTEGLQFARKNGIYQSALVANSECKGSGQIQQEIQSEQSDGNCIDSIGNERDATNTNQFDGYVSRFCSGRIPQFEASGIRIDTDTRMQRCEKQCPIPESKESIFNNGLSDASRRDWRNFPTQSPVCRRNDGLPFDVVRLTISLTAWCTGSIKGYGNAIVPQVMYEIFKAIETIQE